MNTEPIIEAKGTTGQITLYENRVDITRKGFGNALIHGIDGTKSIFLSKLSGIQFSGNEKGGYIQFIFPGSEESKKGIFDAVKDENSVFFNKKEGEKFVQIRDYILNNLN